MRFSQPTYGVLLIVPAVALLACLTLYPVFYGIWLSLQAKHSFFPQQSFVGLANYLYLLNDPEFWDSLWRGVIYSLSTISLHSSHLYPAAQPPKDTLTCGSSRKVSCPSVISSQRSTVTSSKRWVSSLAGQ